MKSPPSLLGWAVCAASLVDAINHRSSDWTVGQVVKTSSGLVSGHGSSVNTDVSEYLGIPYAVPPVGDLRWTAPEAFKGTKAINGTSFVGYSFSSLSIRDIFGLQMRGPSWNPLSVIPTSRYLRCPQLPEMEHFNCECKSFGAVQIQKLDLSSPVLDTNSYPGILLPGFHAILIWWRHSVRQHHSFRPHHPRNTWASR